MGAVSIVKSFSASFSVALKSLKWKINKKYVGFFLACTYERDRSFTMTFTHSESKKYRRKLFHFRILKITFLFFSTFRFRRFLLLRIQYMTWYVFRKCACFMQWLLIWTDIDDERNIQWVLCYLDMLSDVSYRHHIFHFHIIPKKRKVLHSLKDLST